MYTASDSVGTNGKSYEDLETENRELKRLLNQGSLHEKKTNELSSYYSMRMKAFMICAICVLAYCIAHTYGKSIVNVLGPYSPEYLFARNIMTYSSLAFIFSALWAAMCTVIVRVKSFHIE
ncbi:MAG: hypothetical protein WCT49_00045 [Candidatus Paceibacterota bacterium]|jgi:hypothetical protein|nr:hypothetical protein [Candidatus Paceibacterota bacterium]